MSLGRGTQRRRTQRTIRITVAVVLMALAVVLVLAAVVWSFAVSAAAVLGVLAGTASTRIMYTEVTQTRWEAAQDRAVQARGFVVAFERLHADHQAHRVLLDRAVRDRDRTIRELGSSLSLAQRRAVEAEGRALREARRANDAQERLAALLDEVLGTTDPDAEGDFAAIGDVARDAPTADDLATWDAAIGSAGQRGVGSQADAGAVA